MYIESGGLFVVLVGMHGSRVVLARNERPVRQVVVHYIRAYTIVLGEWEAVLGSVLGARCLAEVYRIEQCAELTNPRPGRLHPDGQ